MHVFGMDLTSDEVVKLVVAVLALLAAVLKLFPTVVASARRHGAEAHLVSSDNRLVGLPEAPMPFDLRYAKGYSLEYDDQEARDRRDEMTRRTHEGCIVQILLAALLLLLTVLWPWGVPWLRMVLAAVAVVALVVVTVIWVRFQRDPARHSAATPCRGSVVVEGDPADVRQRALTGLLEIGAKVVWTDRNRILAYTGVGVLVRNALMGEVIWVVVRSRGRKHTVEIVSTKADFVSLSRSARNVRNYLDSWLTLPSAAA